MVCASGRRILLEPAQNRPNRCGDNGLASPQIVGSHGMLNGVTLPDHDHPGLPERLFD